jgi:hypothetical protein
VGLLFESQIPKIFRMYISERKITLLVVLCDLDESSNQTFLCTPSQMPPPIALGSQCQVDSSQCVDFNEENDWSLEDVGDGVESSDERNGQFEDARNNVEFSVEKNETTHSISYDFENPIIEVNDVFLDVITFRKAVRHFVIKNEFEVATLKSDKKRYKKMQISRLSLENLCF